MTGEYKLKYEGSGGAWCPKGMISNDGRQYLEVNLQGLHAVTAIKSQGRYGNGSGKEFVEEIMIDYWRPGSNKWTRWKGRDGWEPLVSYNNWCSASVSVERNKSKRYHEYLGDDDNLCHVSPTTVTPYLHNMLPPLFKHVVKDKRVLLSPQNANRNTTAEILNTPNIIIRSMSVWLVSIRVYLKFNLRSHGMATGGLDIDPAAAAAAVALCAASVTGVINLKTIIREMILIRCMYGNRLWPSGRGEAVLNSRKTWVGGDGGGQRGGGGGVGGGGSWKKIESSKLIYRWRTNSRNAAMQQRTVLTKYNKQRQTTRIICLIAGVVRTFGCV
ncbi:hypothetical protein QTP88_023532 [Uroleucon formosanum]